MIVSSLIDSSVWIEYLFNNKFHEVIDSERVLHASSLSLFEIKKKLLKEKVDHQKMMTAISFVKKRALVIPPAASIAEMAADYATKHHLAAMDALIYATAVASQSDLITCDNDFRGLAGVSIVK